MQDDLGASKDEPRDGAPTRRDLPKFNSQRPADQNRLQNRSRSIHDEIGWIEYQGELVYHTPVQNALASWMLIDQLNPTYQKTTKKSTHM
jgi:hypothetical protein